MERRCCGKTFSFAQLAAVDLTIYRTWRGSMDWGWMAIGRDEADRETGGRMLYSTRYTLTGGAGG
jgi:hypothetical protein